MRHENSLRFIVFLVCLLLSPGCQSMRNSKAARILTDGGNAKIELHNFVGAIVDFDQAIKLAPKFAAAYDGRSLANSI